MEQRKGRMTVDEYLEQSPSWEGRWEYIDGEIYAMAGGRGVHGAVGNNVILSLGTSLRGGPCRTTSSDQRVFVEATGNFFFPDAVVVCRNFQYTPDGQSLTNPALICEVLSPSTADFDRGRKLEEYMTIPSLHDLLIIDPDARTVVHHTRNAMGWLRVKHDDGTVLLSKLHVELPLHEVFDNLESVLADDPTASTASRRDR